MDDEVLMTLGAFIASERKRLEKFERFWKRGQENEPDDFPVELSLGDWDIQYQVFSEEGDE